MKLIHKIPLSKVSMDLRNYQVEGFVLVYSEGYLKVYKIIR